MKKNSKKSIIDKYYNDVYEVYLVVANENVKLEDLQKLYIYADKVELDNRILEGQATTSDCIDKKTNANVILVKYNKGSKDKARNKELNFINTCSHEAGHVALDIYELIDQHVCFCTPEPLCYLIGWATECIYKTLKNVK
jgi:hypothetical protein